MHFSVDNQALRSRLLNVVAGDIYDLELIIIGYDFEENRWASTGERLVYFAFAAIPGSAKVLKGISEEVAEKIIKEVGEELFEKAAKETGEEVLEKGIKEGTSKLIFKVDDDVLKHADVGDFTIDPKTGLISKMKCGGHGQSNLDLSRK